MQLITFSTGSRARLGVKHGERVLDLAGTYGVLECSGRLGSAGMAVRDGGSWLGDALTFLQGGAAAWELAERLVAYAGEPGVLEALVRLGLAVSLDEISFLPPVTNPGKIVCLGLNYRAHAEEAGRALPEFPVLFAKFANTLIGHGVPIPLPPASVSRMVDYEAELVVVIGRTARQVPAARALDYVAGYAPFNDVSVRDFQRRTPQWLQGKAFDGAGPIGPALVSRDEVPDPDNLPIGLTLNGEVMQSASTSQLIFDIPSVIEYITRIMTLEPGDHIATGTPSGVGFARTPPVFLEAGDVVEVEIGGVGRLRNPVAGPAGE